MKVIRLSLIICCALAFASCSLKPAWDVAGTWQKVDGKETIEFSRTGVVIMKNGMTSITAPFKFADAKQLKIEIGPIGTFEVEVHLAKDTLTLTGPDGKISKYQRVQQ